MQRLSLGMPGSGAGLALAGRGNETQGSWVNG